MLTPNKQQILAKLDYLETQLENLNHYLPETYEFLIRQIDCQKRVLVEIEVNETFELIDTHKAWYEQSIGFLVSLTHIIFLLVNKNPANWPERHK